MLSFIIGCTASGKGSLGRELASRTGGEIISADSMKVYRGMDIGTAKPSAADRAAIPHHLLDVVDPSEEFSVAEYVQRAEKAAADIDGRRRPVFVVGGTALYIKALAEGLFEGPSAHPAIRDRLHREDAEQGRGVLYGRLKKVDPSAAERIHTNDLRRIVRALEVFEITGKPITELQTQWDRERTRHDCLFIALRRNLDDQNSRSNARVHKMIEAGLEREVRTLLDHHQHLSDTARKAVGYAEIIDYLENRCSLAEAVENIKINTRHLAKSQRTWFKRFRDAHGVDVQAGDTAAGIADQLMEQFAQRWSQLPK